MLGAYIPWFVILTNDPHAIGYVDICIEIHLHSTCICMYGMYVLKKCILSFKGSRSHTFDTTIWHINIAIVLFHASFTYLWYGCNNVTYCSYDTYNTCVPYNTYGPYHQMGANCTYGACGMCGSFCAYGVCGTIVANVTCGRYGTTCPLFTSGSHINGPSK
jgi:hypothetical protein